MKLLLYRFIYRQRWLSKLVGAITPPVPVRLPEFKIYVRLNDFGVGLPLVVWRTYEPQVTVVIRHFLVPGCVFVDVGANIGYYTLMAAGRVGTNGSVIAFEPRADNCALLRKSLAANGFGHVRLYPNAVADREGEVGLTLNATDSNASVTGDDQPRSDVRVRTLTLDAILKDEPRVDLIKMDIEGYEGRALQGMLNLIQKHQPVILTEFMPDALVAQSAIQPPMFLLQLRTLGYDLSVVGRDPAGETRPASDETILGYFQTPGATDHLDLLALPKRRRTG